VRGGEARPARGGPLPSSRQPPTRPLPDHHPTTCYARRCEPDHHAALGRGMRRSPQAGRWQHDREELRLGSREPAPALRREPSPTTRYDPDGLLHLLDGWRWPLALRSPRDIDSSVRSCGLDAIDRSLLPSIRLRRRRCPARIRPARHLPSGSGSSLVTPSTGSRQARHRRASWPWGASTRCRLGASAC
jgi:hypothetical protein